MRAKRPRGKTLTDDGRSRGVKLREEEEQVDEEAQVMQEVKTQIKTFSFLEMRNMQVQCERCEKG